MIWMFSIPRVVNKLAFPVILFASLTIVLAVCYAAWLGFRETVYSQRGSLAYYITVSSNTIKEVPKPGLVGVEDYIVYSGDGPRLPGTSVAFKSNESFIAISEMISDYLAARGFEFRSDDGLAGKVFSRGETAVLLDITPSHSKLLDVKITELEGGLEADFIYLKKID